MKLNEYMHINYALSCGAGERAGIASAAFVNSFMA